MIGFSPSQSRNVQLTAVDKRGRTPTGTPEEPEKWVKGMRARMGVKQIAEHGGTRTGAPKVIADFANYVIGKA